MTTALTFRTAPLSGRNLSIKAARICVWRARAGSSIGCRYYRFRLTVKAAVLGALSTRTSQRTSIDRGFRNAFVYSCEFLHLCVPWKIARASYGRQKRTKRRRDWRKERTNKNEVNSGVQERTNEGNGSCHASTCGFGLECRRSPVLLVLAFR